MLSLRWYFLQSLINSLLACDIKLLLADDI